MAARVEFRSDGAADVRFTYDAHVVAQLKLAAPKWFRTYDGGTRAWRVRPPYVDAVVRLLEKHFPGQVEIVDPPMDDRWEPTPINAVDRALHVLHLRPSAPEGLIEVAYRYLAKAAHPDAGGDGDEMRRLNGAVATLRERRVAS